jgi:hypothetical protein
MDRRQREKEEWKIELDDQVKKRYTKKKREFELKRLIEIKEEKRMYDFYFSHILERKKLHR